MIKAAQNLNLVHVTCVAHSIYRAANKLEIFMTLMIWKKVFLKINSEK